MEPLNLPKVKASILDLTFVHNLNGVLAHFVQNRTRGPFMASAKLIQMKHRHMGATLPRFIQMLIMI